MKKTKLVIPDKKKLDVATTKVRPLGDEDLGAINGGYPFTLCRTCSCQC